MLQCTATSLVNVHALEHQHAGGTAILPIPDRIQRRYDTICEHVQWVRGGLTYADDELEATDAHAEATNKTAKYVLGNKKVCGGLLRVQLVSQMINACLRSCSHAQYLLMIYIPKPMLISHGLCNS